MVRVIANMSVNSEVGYGLGIRSPLGSVLLSLLLACNNAEGKMVCIFDNGFRYSNVVCFKDIFLICHLTVENILNL